MTTSRSDSGPTQGTGDASPPASPEELPRVVRAPAHLRSTVAASEPSSGVALPFTQASPDKALQDAQAHAARVQRIQANQARVGGGTLPVDTPTPSPIVEEPPAPGLSLEQTASLEVELASPGAAAEEVFQRYRVTAEQRKQLLAYWSRRIERDGALRIQWNNAYAAYEAWRSQQRAAVSAVAPQPIAPQAIAPQPVAQAFPSPSPETASASPWVRGAPSAFQPPVDALRDVRAPVVAAPQAPSTAVTPERPSVTRAEPAGLLELVWFDPAVVLRLRRKVDWRPVLEAAEQRTPDADFDDPALAEEPMVVEDRRDVFEVLVRATSLDAEGLDAAFGRCARPDGRFVPALALFAGELELPFDELAALRATLTTVAPLANEEALRGAVQAAKDFLATPGLISAPGVAEGLTRRIEDAFAQGKRVVPTGYLEAQRERALIEQRQHQRRVVFGGKHLRGLLTLAGGAAPVPAYLPESAADLLPLASRLRARIIGEIRLAADRYETHAVALRVLALARSVPTRAGTPGR